MAAAWRSTYSVCAISLSVTRAVHSNRMVNPSPNHRMGVQQVGVQTDWVEKEGMYLEEIDVFGLHPPTGG